MVLQFSNVKKYYGAFLALNIPSLVIGEGIWWVKGENGSGKTTLLKMIAGIHPFDGDIRLDELTITKNRQRFVQQVNYAEAEPLYPSFLTARDLLELYCKTKGGSLQSAKEMLKQLHIADAYNKPLGAYSSGMIKKLGIALAFIGNATLILLYEPLITIDAAAVNIVCDLINNAHSQGKSILITSHQTLHNNQLAFTGTLHAKNNSIHL